MPLPALSKKLEINERIDQLEKVMVDNFHAIECPLVHRFTEGMYIREIFMKKGSFITSKIHKTQHPFVVTKGVVSVWVNDGKEILIKAPFTGITEPGTRRILYIHKDTTWITFHPNPNNETIEKIEERIIEKHTNVFLNESINHH